MEGNYTALLNEYGQKHRCDVKYETVAADGPAHLKKFTQRVVLDGKPYPHGVGKSKREAKHNAAKHALNELELELKSSPEPTASSESQAADFQPRGTQPNYICWLNEQSQRTGTRVRAEESVQVGPANATQCCSYEIGDKKYPAACARTKKEAKEEAAKLVHQELFPDQAAEGLDDNGNVSIAQDNELDQSISSIPGTNYIGIVNSYCQQTNYIPDFHLVTQSGPSHCREFFYKLVIGGKHYPVGKGKTAKDAKQNAAMLACSDLQEQPDWNSQVSLKSDEFATSDLATTSNELGSHYAKSQGTETHSDSIMFTNSSRPIKEMSPAVKPKIKLAPKFPKAADNSKEIVNIPDLKGKMATSSTDSTRFLTDFDDITHLGKGGFGHVYKARLIHLQHYYAVKIVRCREKAIREAKALANLEHPNIVRYYSSWLDTSDYVNSTTDSSSSSQSSSDNPLPYLYIQMQLCDEKTLRMWIDDRNTLSQDPKRREEILPITMKIICGVKYIHSKNLIHRDLKPANIMFGLDGEVKIGDFGLATKIEMDSDEERTKGAGTKTYMAPEQRNQMTETAYDKKVDIFAVGLIYFELIWKMSGHERSKMWDNVRIQIFPEGFSATFPEEHVLINMMLREKHEHRPDASDLMTKIELLLKQLL